MNALLIGSNKQPLLQFIPRDNFLYIDDAPSDFPRAKQFDVSVHSFNPLKDIDYKKAREFLHVLEAIFPEGKDTLTNRNSRFQLLTALLSNPKGLDRLIKDTKGTADAYQKIQTLLLSPVLERVLNGVPNFSVKGTIVARLDRAELGDFDCYVLGNLLISQFQRAIVVPDFGFYAHKGHAALIRQNRLIAGVSSFDEVPHLKNQLLQIPHKIGSGATPDDAKLLALYAGILPGTNAYNDFIAGAIGCN